MYNIFNYTIQENIYLLSGILKGLYYQSFGMQYNKPFLFYSLISLILFFGLQSYRQIRRLIYNV